MANVNARTYSIALALGGVLVIAISIYAYEFGAYHVSELLGWGLFIGVILVLLSIAVYLWERGKYYRDRKEIQLKRETILPKVVRSMPRQLVIVVIVFNVLMSLLFVYTTYAFLERVNYWINQDYFIRYWSPFSITVDSREPIPAPYTNIVNYPFMVFWLSIIVNLFLIITILRSKAKQPLQ